MRKVLLPIIALIVFGSLTATAQFTITIPKIPKIKKSQAPSQPPPTAGDNPSSTSQAASSRLQDPRSQKREVVPVRMTPSWAFTSKTSKKREKRPRVTTRPGIIMFPILTITKICT
jgi:hypothetical protein